MMTKVVDEILTAVYAREHTRDFPQNLKADDIWAIQADHGNYGPFAFYRALVIKGQRYDARHQSLDKFTLTEPFDRWEFAVEDAAQYGYTGITPKYVMFVLPAGFSSE